MKIKFLLGIAIAFSFLLAACDNDNDDGAEIEIPEPPGGGGGNGVDSTFTNAVTINYTGDGVEIENPYDEVVVEVDGEHVVVKSTMPESTEVNYVLTGNTQDGSLKIYSDFRFGLIMNSVSITNTYGPAINIQSGKRAAVTLMETTENLLVDGVYYPAETGEDMKAAFFSEGQLIFDGKGSLTVYGRNRHGICSDDHIRIKEGNITVEFSLKDAIHVNDYFKMDGGKLTVTNAASNGIECERGYIEINDGTIDIYAGNDIIIASYKESNPNITPYIEINGGDIKLRSNKDEANGIRSRDNLMINGGNIDVEVVEDGIKSAGNLSITDGYVYTSSSKNDGIDAKGPLTISGGTIVACGSSNSKRGIDSEESIHITGGTVVGVGSSKTDPDIIGNSQYAVIYSGNCSENELINISGTDDENILTFKPPRSYSTLRFLVSNPLLKANSQYTLNKGGTVSSYEVDFYGLYFEPDYSGGIKIADFSTSSKLTKIE